MALGKPSIVYCQVRDGAERSEINILPIGSLRIVRIFYNACREIPDAINLFVWQKTTAHCGEVEPLVPGASHCAIVEIETVDIDFATKKCPTNIMTTRRVVITTLPPEATGGGMPIL